MLFLEYLVGILHFYCVFVKEAAIENWGPSPLSQPRWFSIKCLSIKFCQVRVKKNRFTVQYDWDNVLSEWHEQNLARRKKINPIFETLLPYTDEYLRNMGRNFYKNYLKCNYDT